MLILSSPVVLPFPLEPLVVQARADCGMKHDRLAYLMGISSQQLSMALAMRGQLSFYRLLMATREDDGREFFGVLIGLVCEQLGLEQIDRVAQMLKRAIDVFQARETKPRMVKADLRNSDTERRTA